MKKPLIVLTGPTAVGKTALSIALAKQLGCEIISADSMQIYKYMDIGSAKIMPQEMEGVPHYLVDVLKPEEEFHVVRFQQMAKEAMEQIYAHGNIPLLVGGTGFYIQAVTRDIDFTEGEEDRVYRSSLEEIAKTKGPEILHQRLQEIDPPSAASIHANNVKRVIRALEFYHLNGYPISRHNQQESEKESPYNLAYFVLNDERSHLYERIDKRVDLMMESGLVEEVCRLKAMGYDRSMVSMQGLGYKELLAWMDGEFSLDEAVRILKRDTRHFAKRQITWFKREKDVIWMNKPDYDYDDKKILAEMKQICKERGIY
ncbi:MAG: tRNA (adenosine(37)-N6)-dimethylallyltransferase MiaA [Lachnospiraceae bacterium]|nr:tRNA (adenosine(37)-N6)-dimethylallyltransferase MiaA [Clostridiales bacterium]MDY4770365.1 tRNA (adenosine(37)-N6)-dimethylallyltransferase MiaA [Lachnospiraceae bacterium]